ncbi:Signal peptidase complex catalytic subunit sec11 [Hondaea fermentalgiana]|uniref:signal peptidase I n=1 Tax=Hondaea fermentalgiana TaxID=2315210 RepID=A0A2R5GNE7_9STRA|nr:Signal peptidase complex catalytic subunit sec11 [Hondaea fermentalgiana]|eukprot:GBG32145.1 Signal peptidase complex catalytic subunit sec11 [Hondaea fermentalgiana]
MDVAGVVEEQVLQLKSLWKNKRALAFQALNLAMIILSALMIWKALMVYTNSESPVVVVLTGSMEPGILRGDILFLDNTYEEPIRVGEVVVFKIDEREIPIVHRVLEVHVDKSGHQMMLTKGDNNNIDDRRGGIYARGQRWLHRDSIMGRARVFVPKVGMGPGHPSEALQERPGAHYDLGVMTTLERASQPGLLDLWRNSRKGRAVLALWVGVAASVSAQAVLQKRRKARKRTWSRMVAPSLTSLQDRVQRDEGAFRGAHSRLKEYVQEVQFARGETVEAARLEDLFRSVARTKTLHGAQRFASGALDGYAVRYMGILAALAMMTPALSDPARNVEDPTEFFLTCLHLLVNLMSAFKDIALAFRALSAVRALASRVNALLVVGHGITHPVTTSARTPAGQAAVERQALEKLSRGEDTGKIIVDRITITASGVEILHKFSCTFQQGESVFIRGHNGAGKTSLLRVLRGMWSPAAGTVTCNVPASALLFMTQRPYFLQGATLREQLLYPQRSGDAIVVDDDVLLEAISRVGLESVVMQPAVSSLDQEFGTDGLSAGEAQRLACARVLVRRPVFCFADECTGSCTEAFETAFFTHCIEDLGITMITVSHRSAVQSLHARVLDLSDTSASHVSPDVEKN